MKLTVEVKNVYGNDLVYPVCDYAKGLCRITGQRTFSNWHIEELKGLGFTFTQQEKDL